MSTRLGLSSHEEGSVGQPRDRFYLIYICMIVAGGGFLFPWFSFISAVDYFFFLYSEDHPQVSVAVPMTYLITTLCSSTINVALVDKVPVHGRIAFGYVMFIMSLLFIPLLDIGIHNCTVSTNVSFYLTLLAIVWVGLGSGVQQSSYYGLGSMLPRKYSQGLMAGESVAGMAVAICRIITKAAFSSERGGAIAFFTACLVFLVVCVGCQVCIRASPFVRYHTAKCSTKKTGHSEEVQGDEGLPLEGISESDQEERLIPAEQEGRLGDNDGVSLEGIPDQEERLMSDDGEGRESVGTKFYRAVRVRVVVIRQIWRLLVAVTASYLITLLVFPGIISEVQFSPLKDWMPILLITVFNFFDLVAKWLALIPIPWSPTGLMLGSLMRAVLLPLIVLCVSPSPSNPVFHHGILVWSIIFTMLLGITNGYFGSLPLINTAQEVHKDKHRELAGTIMVWFLLGGLTAGSVLAYALTPLTELAEEHSRNTSTVNVFNRCS